ncbi:hypothetical protein IWQ62_000727 [Dispira parvispora]|uniref:Uncharacterized protein n=1 Tax=Dispira parvispora TaxID=1520584 RepID=A0A9W8AXR4_9FUNG|nr:hypothetical protein IWQ62_000727 [Dispira parvispora]
MAKISAEMIEHLEKSSEALAQDLSTHFQLSKQRRKYQKQPSTQPMGHATPITGTALGDGSPMVNYYTPLNQTPHHALHLESQQENDYIHELDQELAGSLGSWGIQSSSITSLAPALVTRENPLSPTTSSRPSISINSQEMLDTSFEVNPNASILHSPSSDRAPEQNPDLPSQISAVTPSARTHPDSHTWQQHRADPSFHPSREFPKHLWDSPFNGVNGTPDQGSSLHFWSKPESSVTPVITSQEIQEALPPSMQQRPTGTSQSRREPMSTPRVGGKTRQPLPDPLANESPFSKDLKLVTVPRDHQPLDDSLSISLSDVEFDVMNSAIGTISSSPAVPTPETHRQYTATESDVLTDSFRTQGKQELLFHTELGSGSVDHQDLVTKFYQFMETNPVQPAQPATPPSWATGNPPSSKRWSSTPKPSRQTGIPLSVPHATPGDRLGAVQAPINQVMSPVPGENLLTRQSLGDSAMGMSDAESPEGTSKVEASSKPRQSMPPPNPPTPSDNTQVAASPTPAAPSPAGTSLKGPMSIHLPPMTQNKMEPIWPRHSALPNPKVVRLQSPPHAYSSGRLPNARRPPTTPHPLHKSHFMSSASSSSFASSAAVTHPEPSVERIARVSRLEVPTAPVPQSSPMKPAHPTTSSGVVPTRTTFTQVDHTVELRRSSSSHTDISISTQDVGEYDPSFDFTSKPADENTGSLTRTLSAFSQKLMDSKLSQRTTRGDANRSASIESLLTSHTKAGESSLSRSDSQGLTRSRSETNMPALTTNELPTNNGADAVHRVDLAMPAGQDNLNSRTLTGPATVNTTGKVESGRDLPLNSNSTDASPLEFGWLHNNPSLVPSKENHVSQTISDQRPPSTSPQPSQGDQFRTPLRPGPSHSLAQTPLSIFSSSFRLPDVYEVSHLATPKFDYRDGNYYVHATPQPNGPGAARSSLRGSDPHPLPRRYGSDLSLRSASRRCPSSSDKENDRPVSPRSPLTPRNNFSYQNLLRQTLANVNRDKGSRTPMHKPLESVPQELQGEAVVKALYMLQEQIHRLEQDKQDREGLIEALRRKLAELEQKSSAESMRPPHATLATQTSQVVESERGPMGHPPAQVDVGVSPRSRVGDFTPHQPPATYDGARAHPSFDLPGTIQGIRDMLDQMNREKFTLNANIEDLWSNMQHLEALLYTKLAPPFESGESMDRELADRAVSPRPQVERTPSPAIDNQEYPNQDGRSTASSPSPARKIPGQERWGGPEMGTSPRTITANEKVGPKNPNLLPPSDHPEYATIVERASPTYWSVHERQNNPDEKEERQRALETIEMYRHELMRLLQRQEGEQKKSKSRRRTKSRRKPKPRSTGQDPWLESPYDSDALSEALSRISMDSPESSFMAEVIEPSRRATSNRRRPIQPREMAHHPVPQPDDERQQHVQGRSPISMPRVSRRESELLEQIRNAQLRLRQQAAVEPRATERSETVHVRHPAEGSDRRVAIPRPDSPPQVPQSAGPLKRSAPTREIGTQVRPSLYHNGPLDTETSPVTHTTDGRSTMAHASCQTTPHPSTYVRPTNPEPGHQFSVENPQLSSPPCQCPIILTPTRVAMDGQPLPSRQEERAALRKLQHQSRSPNEIRHAASSPRHSPRLNYMSPKCDHSDLHDSTTFFNEEHDHSDKISPDRSSRSRRRDPRWSVPMGSQSRTNSLTSNLQRILTLLQSHSNAQCPLCQQQAALPSCRHDEYAEEPEWHHQSPMGTSKPLTHSTNCPWAEIRRLVQHLGTSSPVPLPKDVGHPEGNSPDRLDATCHHLDRLILDLEHEFTTLKSKYQQLISEYDGCSNHFPNDLSWLAKKDANEHTHQLGRTRLGRYLKDLISLMDIKSRQISALHEIRHRTLPPGEPPLVYPHLAPPPVRRARMGGCAACQLGNPGGKRATGPTKASAARAKRGKMAGNVLVPPQGMVPGHRPISRVPPTVERNSKQTKNYALLKGMQWIQQALES